MKKMEQLYEGKAKKVFKTDDENIVDYKMTQLHLTVLKRSNCR